ncbi:MAG: cell wall hydrolase [Oscillibacter sp.]|jgi:N-acetylmuramoyl-L-alanine amidase|nr:cell wall hydrolase [Oscillibacter sp.]
MKRTLLTGFTVLVLCLCAALPAQAARTVPVTVDGVLLSGTSYVDSGATAVPLRALCQALGGWSVCWDSEARCASAERDGVRITAVPGLREIRVDGTAYVSSCAVRVENGCTYVPLRALCEALGYQVSWDSSLGGAAVTTGAEAVSYSQEDLYWLSRVISAESRGESSAGQIAVGNVVLNRVASREFPNTVKSVVFDTKDGVQFEPTSNSAIYDTPTAQSVAAAKAALGGQSVVGACLYFYAPALSQGKWINANRAYFTTIGCHRFYL